ncbi:MAG: ATP-dependent DNA ligase [Solirubrobacterales bacterium]
MPLPLSPGLAPQLARSRAKLPDGDGWAYEPKWDGFRALAFVDGGDLHIQSRNGRPLGRYFPELEFAAGRYVLDGEIVVLDADGREDFDAIGNRIHPAESRINRLAVDTPAVFRAFDLLALDDASLLDSPFSERRAALEQLALGATELTPIAYDEQSAQPWLRDGEGVIAKELDAPYLPGERKGMVKIKRVRTADCVVAGWRPGKEPGTVGSLMLALYDGDELRVVGHTSGLTAKAKHELVETLAPYESGERGSADPSRWDADRELEWVALRPELVVEVRYDHVSNGRIRHGAKIVRWRTDKDAADCRIEDLDP